MFAVYQRIQWYVNDLYSVKLHVFKLETFSREKNVVHVRSKFVLFFIILFIYMHMGESV